MNIFAMIQAALEAVAWFYKTASIRERTNLRAELRHLRHEIKNAAESGDSSLLAELQDAFDDARADYQAIRPAASHPSS